MLSDCVISLLSWGETSSSSPICMLASANMLATDFAVVYIVILLESTLTFTGNALAISIVISEVIGALRSSEI